MKNSLSQYNNSGVGDAGDPDSLFQANKKIVLHWYEKYSVKLYVKSFQNYLFYIRSKRMQ